MHAGGGASVCIAQTCIHCIGCIHDMGTCALSDGLSEEAMKERDTGHSQSCSIISGTHNISALTCGWA